MVEIALCLGIIAIALVAIIGVLPLGLQVQRENREDTIINQDGTLWLEAIRSGAWGMDYLTNYVQAITISNLSINGVSRLVYLSEAAAQDPVFSSRLARDPDSHFVVLTNGYNIIGLLSTPKYELIRGRLATNIVTAVVKSISGSAANKSSMAQGIDFAYELRSEVVPMTFGYHLEPSLTNFNEPNLGVQDYFVRSNRWLEAINQAANFSELRLTLQGPTQEKTIQGVSYYVPIGTPQVYRTTVGGQRVIHALDLGNGREVPLAFFFPMRFERVVQ